ncbi:MAG: hypothetical protein ACYTFO_07385 [Planctomycetota bacterium]|jgi:hypothetical protein
MLRLRHDWRQELKLDRTSDGLAMDLPSNGPGYGLVFVLFSALLTWASLEAIDIAVNDDPHPPGLPDMIYMACFPVSFALLSLLGVFLLFRRYRLIFRPEQGEAEFQIRGPWTRSSCRMPIADLDVRLCKWSIAGMFKAGAPREQWSLVVLWPGAHATLCRHPELDTVRQAAVRLQKEAGVQ